MSPAAAPSSSLRAPTSASRPSPSGAQPQAPTTTTRAPLRLRQEPFPTTSSACDGSVGRAEGNSSLTKHGVAEMPVTVGPYGQSQPSCFDRVKMGFMMGFAVGMAAGALFGTFSSLRFGLRGRELMSGVGKTMLQSGGTFGTFMSIGMGIRC